MSRFASRAGLAAVAAALLLVACGGGGTATTTTTTTPTTTTAATTTITAADDTTTTTTTTSPGDRETIELPDQLGEFEKVEFPIDIAEFFADAPLDVAGFGIYGRRLDPDQPALPEYFIVVGGSSAIGAADPDEVLQEVLAGFAEGEDLELGAAQVETEGGVTYNCFEGLTEGEAFAVCIMQEEAAIGIVFSIPGVGPSDIATALTLSKLVVTAT